MPLFSLNDRTSPLAFQPDSAFVTAADMAPSDELDAGVPNGDLIIHAFSYFGQVPGISQRVVNETAAIVDYLNELPR